MSITVEQIMRLPGMRGARVLAGREGLGRIVSTISVLEYSNPDDIQRRLYESIDFQGSELVISAFASVADNIDAQCDNIRYLAAAGEVGLILYYVGIILPKVDERLVRAADELGFVLICMPENDPSLRYSEVICEVMGAIVRDELSSSNFALDLLEQMSRLPKTHQTVKTILRIASDRLRATTAITDAEYNVLSAAAWPRTISEEGGALASLASRQNSAEHCWEQPDGSRMWVYRDRIGAGDLGNMLLLACSEGGRIEPQLWRQTLEGVRLGMSVWGRKHDRVDMSELVRAIVLDEPIKMRRLGDIYRIDVASLSDVWIIRSLDGGSLAAMLGEVRALSAQYAHLGLCESYEEDIVIFPVGSRTLRETEEWASSLAELFAGRGIAAAVTLCQRLQQTSDVKYAYETNRGCVRGAARIFPQRRYFSFSEVEFARECRSIAEAGESRVRWYASRLEALLSRRDGEDIVRTLAVYLLDKNSSLVETAAELFVHKNTVKYRLQKAGDILGFHIGDIPQSKDLIYALALRRLLRSEAPGA